MYIRYIIQAYIDYIFKMFTYIYITFTYIYR